MGEYQGTRRYGCGKSQFVTYKRSAIYASRPHPSLVPIILSLTYISWVRAYRFVNLVTINTNGRQRKRNVTQPVIFRNAAQFIHYWVYHLHYQVRRLPWWLTKINSPEDIDFLSSNDSHPPPLISYAHFNSRVSLLNTSTPLTQATLPWDSGKWHGRWMCAGLRGCPSSLHGKNNKYYSVGGW